MAGTRSADLSARVAERVLRTRALVRAPIWLYRHGLGFLFGQRLLLLQHTGRRSGQPRFVVLEVVDRPAADRYLVVSGFGARAQWYRNLVADPRVRVSVGRRRDHPATASLLDREETGRALAAYAREHPRAWAQLRSVMERTLDTPVEELPMFALDLDGPP